MALKYVPLNGTTVTKHYVLDCPTYDTCREAKIQKNLRSNLQILFLLPTLGKHVQTTDRTHQQ